MYIRNQTYIQWTHGRHVEIEVRLSPRGLRYYAWPWWLPGCDYQRGDPDSSRRFLVAQWLGLTVWLYLPFPKAHRAA